MTSFMPLFDRFVLNADVFEVFGDGADDFVADVILFVCEVSVQFLSL